MNLQPKFLQPPQMRSRRTRKRQRLDPSALPPRKRNAPLAHPKAILKNIPSMQRSIIRAPPRHPTVSRTYSLPPKVLNGPEHRMRNPRIRVNPGNDCLPKIINGTEHRMHNPRVRAKPGNECVQKVRDPTLLGSRMQNPRTRRTGDDDYVPKELADDDSDEDFLPDEGDSATEAQFCDLCRMQKTEPLRPIPRKPGLFACNDCMRPRRRKAVRHPGTIVLSPSERNNHYYSRRGRRSKDSNIVPPHFLPFVVAKERSRNIFMTCQYCGWRKTWKASLYRSKTAPNVKICNSCRRCENHFGRLIPRNSVDRRQIESKKRTADRGIRFLGSGNLMFEPVVIQQTIEAGTVDWEKLKASHCKFNNFDPNTQDLLRPEYLEKLRTTARVFPDKPPVSKRYDPTCEYLLNGPFFDYQKTESTEKEESTVPPPLSKGSPVSFHRLERSSATKMVG